MSKALQGTCYVFSVFFNNDIKHADILSIERPPQKKEEKKKEIGDFCHFVDLNW